MGFFSSLPMTEGILADPNIRDMRTKRIPLGRIGTAEEIALGVLYLANRQAKTFSPQPG